MAVCFVSGIDDKGPGAMLPIELCMSGRTLELEAERL